VTALSTIGSGFGAGAGAGAGVGVGAGVGSGLAQAVRNVAVVKTNMRHALNKIVIILFFLTGDPPYTLIYLD